MKSSPSFVLALSLAVAMLLTACTNTVTGFVLHAASSSTTTTTKRTSTSIQQSKQSTGDFEYQELLVQLGAMEAQNVKFSILREDKATEIEGYVRKVVTRRPSPMILAAGSQVAGTSWKLIYSNQALMLGLPADATVIYDFLDEQRLNYRLEFGAKTWGLQRLVAKCSYQIDERGNSMTYVYDDVTTDVFGMKLGAGMFGLLQGRSNTANTVYLDDTIWIERGFDQAKDGLEYFNVYTPTDVFKDS